MFTSLAGAVDQSLCAVCGSGLAVLKPSVYSAVLRGGCLCCTNCTLCQQLIKLRLLLSLLLLLLLLLLQRVSEMCRLVYYQRR